MNRRTQYAFVLAFGVLLTAAAAVMEFGYLHLVSRGATPSVTTYVGGGEHGLVARVGKYDIVARQPLIAGKATLGQWFAACGDADPPPPVTGGRLTTSVLPVLIDPPGDEQCVPDHSDTTSDGASLSLAVNDVAAVPSSIRDQPRLLLSKISAQVEEGNSKYVLEIIEVVLLGLGPAFVAGAGMALLQADSEDSDTAG